MRLSNCLFAVLVVIGQAAAWNCPGGVKGSDKVTGSSAFFGITEDKPLTYIDHTTAWKKFGPITKVNLYYSHNYGCLQGIKVTYGYDAHSAQLIGIQKGLSEADLHLGAYEGITKVEIREAASSKCIEYIKLTSSKGKSVSIGAAKGGGPLSSAPAKGGFLAAVRGYEDLLKGQAVTKGGLQKLQFIWGAAICPVAKNVPKPVPEGVPEAPVVPVPENPAPVEGNAPEEPLKAEGLCPADTTSCDASATSGDAVCPAIAPFTYNQCVGGCCISAGKCKNALCGANGLGSEVLAASTLCWGTNGGLTHKFNKCRNLACKLAVPGCVTDHISGTCVGSVVALSNDVDPSSAEWVGYPCLQTVPGGLPIDALGHSDVNGAYTAKLWSICNCKAQSHHFKFHKGHCDGPLCPLFKRPDLPSVNLALTNISLADIGPLVDLHAWNFSQIGVLFAPPSFNMPKVKIQIPDLSEFTKELRKYINDTSKVLHNSPSLIKALKPELPAFEVDVSGAEIPTVSYTLPASNVDAADLLPTVDLSELPTDKNGLPTFNVSHLNLPSVQKVLGAFDVHAHLSNLGVPTDPKVINETIDYVHGQLSEAHLKAP